MNIKEQIEYNIDRIQDGIDFKMLLFNEGKYDKEEVRTVIKNVGLKLSILNRFEIPIEVKNIYLGIFNHGKLKNLYSSNQLSLQLPKVINFNKEFSVYFYGWDIKEKFEQFKNENGMFIFSTSDNNKTFHSSKFDGDDIEKKITYLEDGELANWGSKKYYLFDVESKI
jgi:hypothetical protein